MPGGEHDKVANEPKAKRLTILDNNNKIHQAISIEEKLSDLFGGDEDKDFRPGSAGRIFRACITGNTEDLNRQSIRHMLKELLLPVVRLYYLSLVQ